MIGALANSQYQVFGAVVHIKVAGVHELDAISAIHAQLALLIKKLNATNVRAIQTQNSSYDSYEVGQSSNNRQVGNFSYPQNERTKYANNY